MSRWVAINKTMGRLISFPGEHPYIFVMVAILLVEVAFFGRTLNKVGFYLDDWSMLGTLTFGPKSLFAMMQHYLLTDSKVTIRPLQAPHHALMFSLFAATPLGFHVTNLMLETVSGWLLFVCLDKMLKNQLLAFLAALLFICYPVHDSTHYWVLAGSVSLSLVFYLISLWATMLWAETNRAVFLACALITFAASIFNYETFLPLCLVNVISIPLVTGRDSRWKFDRAVVGKMIVSLIGSVACVGSLWFHQRVIVPRIGTGWLHSVHIDPAQVLRTTVDGIAVTAPPHVLDFALKESGFIVSSLHTKDWIFVVIVSLITCWGILALSQRQKLPVNWTLSTLFGAFVIAVSFSIFGLNSEYTPTLETIVNRINTGAAIGWGLTLAASIIALARAVQSKLKQRPVVFAMIISASMTALLTIFAVTTWSIAEPWVVSWRAQTGVMDIVARNKENIVKADSIILLNCPRYVRWSPVYDGVWDFQSMVRVVTGSSELKGGVVSDRLQIEAQSISDVSSGYLCGKYAIANMLVLIPTRTELVPISSANHFIDLVDSASREFGPGHAVVQRWRRDLLSAHGRGTL